MLSDALAAASTDTPDGSGTSMWSAYGTRTRSARKPPQYASPKPKPYVDPHGTVAQLPVRPAVQGPQAPHETWNGTITRSPGAKAVTVSPTSTTSATPSCPIAYGAGNGARPATIRSSRSHVATAIGRTRAASSLSSAGEGPPSRHSSASGPVNVSAGTPTTQPVRARAQPPPASTHASAAPPRAAARTGRSRPRRPSSPRPPRA